LCINICNLHFNKSVFNWTFCQLLMENPNCTRPACWWRCQSRWGCRRNSTRWCRGWLPRKKEPSPGRKIRILKPGNPYWRVRLSTVDLLALTSLISFLCALKILFTIKKNYC